MPELGGMLEPRECQLHDPGRPVHSAVQFLRSGDGETGRGGLG